MTAKKTAGRPRGRPSKLTPERADRLIALLAQGTSIKDAAAAIGVTRRCVHYWRLRAYSARPVDQPFVELEKRLQAALLKRAAKGNPWLQEFDPLDPRLAAVLREVEQVGLDSPDRAAPRMSP